jgi:hypothetical protein
MAKKELAVVEQSQALVSTAGYENFEGGGFENQTQQDTSVPFLAILQGLSPILKTREDLRQGMIYNTVTGEAVKGSDGVAFIPATTQHLFMEWAPRKEGGGFVAQHALDSEIVKKAISTQPFGKYTNGKNDLIDTFYVFGVVVGDAGELSPVTISFKGTGIKKYRAWMTKAGGVQIKLEDGRRIKAPLFSHRYRMKTVAEKNNQGEFFNWDITWDATEAQYCRLPTTDGGFLAAVALSKAINEGRAKANVESTTATTATDEETPF